MNTDQDNFKNQYINISDIDIYVDYRNKRLKILSHSLLSELIIKEIIDYAKKENLGKIIVNCHKHQINIFEECGFVAEGVIDGFFQGEDATCMSLFLDKRRENSLYEEKENRIIDYCVKNTNRFELTKNKNYTMRQAVPDDIPQMIQLFQAVFETYPTPIFSREYLQKVMRDHVLFMVAEEERKIISIASADLDKQHMNAEITDCATNPKYRGRNILSELIFQLETHLKRNGFVTAYSLSRAKNLGINKSLSKLGYIYRGRLINNCNISGGYEDMNIWVKALKK
ncbi:putative beta-lysine N-acetyltransferase [Dehalobacter restrictus]|jgi:putative beta-lysine N-acetyltransferase|uniref:Beta-lysine N-acetyltransferase n=1 Tax=Dehalobacter restrictus (strain DSM 9455 / PER-K23) TaxID=871738 RepID=A0ABN4BMI3_DEHRP|nr:putative beta-lysine N-acetyltransferase [Dehalobacter restrictus]AHF08753.1 beta-lysine N-acetyltransferase [Dehalobacter restrictus DSM 9455]